MRRRRERYVPQPCGPGPSAAFITRWQRDLALFDRMGPLTKAVAEACPKAIELPAVYVKWRQEQGRSLRDDLLEAPLTDPRVDRSLADYLAAAISQAFGRPHTEFIVERRSGSRR